MKTVIITPLATIRMNKILIITTCLLMSLFGRGQTDTVGIVFNQFYEINEGQYHVKYYSMLYDSTYFPNENLTFIRVLSFGKNSELYNAMVSGQYYELIIQRKLQHSLGCRNDLIRIRSGRAMTDKGTLFDSAFLEEQKEFAKGFTCDYMAIEYYYVLEIIKTVANK